MDKQPIDHGPLANISFSSYGPPFFLYTIWTIYIYNRN